MIADLKPYAEYKDSGQNWLGKVPLHWALAPGHSAFRARKDSNRGLKERTVLSLSYGRIKVKPTDKQTVRSGPQTSPGSIRPQRTGLRRA